MSKGKWGSVVDELSRDIVDDSSGGESGVLSQTERHTEILRKKLLNLLRTSSQPHLKSAAKSHAEIGGEIDSVIDAIVSNASKDGLDLDGELLEVLTKAAANLHAIQVKWKEIENLLINN